MSRWGASTAADAARLEQDWLEHLTDTRIEVISSQHALGAALTGSQELTVHQQRQQQHQYSKHDSPLSHWTSIDPGSLPGAFVGGLAEAATQSAQLRHTNHMAEHRSASGIPVLLEDAADLNSSAEQVDPTLASDRQVQPRQSHTAPCHDAQLDTPALDTGRQQQLRQLQTGIKLLCISGSNPVAAGSARIPSHEHIASGNGAMSMRQPVHHQLQQQHHGQPDVQPLHSEAPHQGPDSPNQPQVLRYRQRPGEGKRRGIRGILSLAHHPYCRVAPEANTPPVNRIEFPVRKSDSSMLSTDSVGDGRLVMAECIRKSSTDGTVVTRNSGGLVAARSLEYVKPGQPTMHVALQQSILQVRACTLQLEEHNMQQQTMQKALQLMGTKCGAMLEGLIRMQQQNCSKHA